ncbi:MAG: gallidermin family lantibiotic [Eubacteriales bacterium]|nr:gallidermin family lantibiotic [Eubacteriales bacterium]
MFFRHGSFCGGLVLRHFFELCTEDNAVNKQSEDNEMNKRFKSKFFCKDGDEKYAVD